MNGNKLFLDHQKYIDQGLLSRSEAGNMTTAEEEAVGGEPLGQPRGPTEPVTISTPMLALHTACVSFVHLILDPHVSN